MFIGGIPGMIDIHTITTNYLNYCKKQKRLSNKTIKAYSIDIVQFINYSSEHDFLMKSTITDYIGYLNDSFKLKSVKRKIASIKAFFNFMESEEIIHDNPFAKIKINFQKEQILPKFISLQTIKSILATAYDRFYHSKTDYFSFTAKRDIAVLELLFATGIRVSELCLLNTCDVDLNHGIINIMGKGAKERLIQIGNKDVLKVIREYKESRTSFAYENEYFFVNRLKRRLSDQSVRFMIKDICIEAGILQHVTPHMFRHSFATLLLEEDVDIRYIQNMLGHSSIRTTQIYTQVSSKKQRQILTMKHPRNKININHLQ